jgi:hypothetical protein
METSTEPTVEAEGKRGANILKPVFTVLNITCFHDQENHRVQNIALLTIRMIIHLFLPQLLKLNNI